MPKALTRGSHKLLAVFCTITASTLVASHSWATPHDGPESVDLIIVDSCGGEHGPHRLREELDLRLPDVQITDTTESLSPWRIHWIPQEMGGCELLVESDHTETVLALDREPEDEDIRFVASRVSWIISVDGDESAGLLGPTLAEQEEEEIQKQARQLARRAHNRATFIGADLRAADLRAMQRAQQSLSNATAELDSLVDAARSAADDALRTEQDALRVEEAQWGDDSPGPRSGYPIVRGTRFTLLPGVVLAGRNLDVPRTSINLFGRNDSFDGFEIGLLNFVDDYGAGVQIAMFANWIDGPFRGTQIAAAGNRAAELQGNQFANLFNAVDGETRGVQASGLFNYADHGRGFQTSMINNVAGDWTGLQLGLLNVAGEVRGVQLGLINISRSATVPVGLINISLDYPPRLWAWSGTPGYSYLGVRGGGKRLRYGFTLGQRTLAQSEGQDNRTFGINAGVHLPLTENLFGDLDLATMVFTNDLQRMVQSGRPIQQLRTTLGWRIYPRFAPIIGLSITRMYENDGAYEPLFSLQTSNYQIWPELILGVVF